MLNKLKQIRTQASLLGLCQGLSSCRYGSYHWVCGSHRRSHCPGSLRLDALGCQEEHRGQMDVRDRVTQEAESGPKCEFTVLCHTFTRLLARMAVMLNSPWLYNDQLVTLGYQLSVSQTTTHPLKSIKSASSRKPNITTATYRAPTLC